MTELEAKAKAIIVDKLGVDEEEVRLNASFTNDLGADSLDSVELIMEFEKEFNIFIPDDHAEKIETVADAIKYIEMAFEGGSTYSNSLYLKPKENRMSQPDIPKYNNVIKQK